MYKDDIKHANAACEQRKYNDIQLGQMGLSGAQDKQGGSNGKCIVFILI